MLNLCGAVLGRVQRPNEPVLMGPQVLELRQAAVDARTKYLIDLISLPIGQSNRYRVGTHGMDRDKCLLAPAQLPPTTM